MIKRFDELTERVAHGESVLNSLLSMKTKYQQDIENNEQLLETAKKALAIIQTVSSLTQESLKHYITEPVNTALQAVFENPPVFIANIEIKRGKTEVSFFFEVDSVPINPMKFGGGLLNVAAFALRISIWTLNSNEKILLLDEPSHFLSENYQEKFAEMVKMISDKLNIQIIMVTHQKPIIDVAGNVYMVNKDGPDKNPTKKNRDRHIENTNNHYETEKKIKHMVPDRDTITKKPIEVYRNKKKANLQQSVLF